MRGNRAGRLSGKVALITGASSGIGEAIADRFAAEGAVLHLTGTNQGRLDAVSARLAHATSVSSSVVDLAESSKVPHLVEGAVEHQGRLDVLVNCAAMVDEVLRKPAGETTPDMWERAIAVNVSAPFLLSVAALRAFESVGGGSIINVSSIGGIEAFPNFCAYVVSKHALIGLTKSMAVDYGRQGVRVNAIAPGAIDTPQIASEPDRPRYLQRMAAATALDRIGVGSDIAGVAVFLASEESSYVTGEVIVVDGGRMVSA